MLAHQARALELASEQRLVIEAPTGGGKTWAAAAPLLDALDAGEGAIYVYPTNSLADDQQSALFELARRGGRSAARVRADGTPEGDRSPHVLIWRVHAAALDESQQELGGRWRGDVLTRVFERLPNRPLWWVTNPDTLYLLCLARYRRAPQLWSRLEPCRTLVLDEFHLYRGPSLVRALLLIELAGVLLGVDRVRILSATLPENTRRLLEEGFGFRRISAEPSAGGYTVQHEIDLNLVPCVRDVTDRMAARIMDGLSDLRAESECHNRVPLVVLRQSVVSAIVLEDTLAKQGVRHEEIGVYRGLSSKAIRSMPGKTLVLGTSALEVGVDFHTSRLLFEARSASSFVQRLGRVGRHEPGSATFYTNPRVAGALEALGPSTERTALLTRASAVLAADDDLAGFASSPYGWAVVRGALDALRRQASALAAPEHFGSILGDVESKLRASLNATSDTAIGSRAVRARLAQSIGFRGSLGSVTVHDVQEERRRGSRELAVYEVDLPAFYRRARCQGGPKPGKLPVVLGYGAPRTLRLFLSMKTAGLADLHAPHPEQMELRVDGQATPWERLLRETEHVVGLFPAALKGSLTWREDVFESADQRIALLDDDALVAAYVRSAGGKR